ncbi:hypothetical protein H8S23_07035 [Anaerofilum sp. BX8]|uniref:Uncharacterized protein n=1 Tax=Anaerofilum hominis TaxID=2763016 RepID=A0A923KXY9_9FIRM|nr:hypothetical protein [Anaerofilum hominis]MBC5581259.1 hypothetical protein [Anaerofilum hominis]
MKFTKRILEEQDHCYAVAVMEADGAPHAFFAAENRGGCFAWDCDTLTRRKAVWEQPGGTMSIVPIPGRPGEFLAVQKFFRLYDWEEACLVWARPDGLGGYQVKELFTLPYLHRFDLLQRDGRTWFIGCTLAAHKQTRDDWSCPGSVYTAPLPQSPEQPFELSVLRDDLYQNHGYARLRRDGYDAGLITCGQGVFLAVPPPAGERDWKLEQLMDQPTSDADVIDIDGDGELEIAAIEPFHGSYFRIYKQLNGVWEQVFQHPEVSEFYHVVRAGTLCGRPVFLGGCRRGKQQLFAVTWDAERRRFETHIVDEGVGPSNAVIYNGPSGDCIFAADREAAQAAVYFAED